MFWYCVCPVADSWCVTFDTQRRSFVYSSKDEALEAAKGAAERNWKLRRVPSGVRVQTGDKWRDVQLFGHLPERLPPEKRHTLRPSHQPRR